MEQYFSSRRGSTKVILPIVAVVLLAAFIIVFARWRSAESRLQQMSLQMNQLANSEQNQERAREIVAAVRKLIDVPNDVEPTVAAIVDVDQLRQRNAFYEKAENGDFLVVTTTRAILYSAKRNQIIDVVPVQITPAETRSSEASSAR